MWKQPATYMTNKSESQSVPGSQLFQPCLSCHHSRGHLCFLLLFSIHHLLLPINATCPSAGKEHGADCYQMLRSQSMSVLIHTARLAVSVWQHAPRCRGSHEDSLSLYHCLSLAGSSYFSFLQAFLHRPHFPPSLMSSAIPPFSVPFHSHSSNKSKGFNST